MEETSIKDLLQDSGSIFRSFRDDYSWVPALFPYDSVPGSCFNDSSPYNEDNPVASCRNADKPWDPSTNFQLTIDGFIICDNVQCVQSDVIDNSLPVQTTIPYI